jgi:hypothetical protein
MALDAKQYLEQLAQTVALADEDKAALLKVASNEKFAKALGDSVLRQEDYSRNMDALKTDRTKWEKFYGDLVTWKAGEEQRIAAILQDNGQQHQQEQQIDMKQFITPQQLKEEMAQRERTTISLLKDMGRIASAHAVEFRETLDTDALEKIAVEKNLTLTGAYQEMVRERREVSQKEKFTNQLKEARDEGARDALAKHKLPVDTQPREYHVMADRDPGKMAGGVEYVPNSGRLTPQGERALREGFAEEWQKAGSTSG